MNQTFLSAAWIAALLIAGCAAETNPPSPLDKRAIRALGELAGLRRSPDPELRAELARIEDEGATPGQLSSDDPADAASPAVLLSEQFDPQLASLVLKKAEAIFPDEQFSLGPVALESAVRLRSRYDAMLETLRAAWQRDEGGFAIDYRSGFVADRAFIDSVAAVVHLEAFHAAEQLAETSPSAALPHLLAMFQASAHLAEVPHVEARLTAAELRRKSLLVLAAIAGEPAFDRSDLAAVDKMIQMQLAAWPPDAAAWTGDRAMTMHSYEIIRMGAVLDLLTGEEIRQFSEEGILQELPGASQRVVDADELYYLQTMRQIIESCRQPFFRRRGLFAEIRTELHDRRNSPDFPLAAARLFLPDVEQAQRLQADDRARVEAWAIALALAGGHESPTYKTNPATGVDYDVQAETTRVAVDTGNASDGLIVVPRFDRPVGQASRLR